MKEKYICAIYNTIDEFLGTAFFINKDKLYTACHCVENIEEGYIKYENKKIAFKNIKKIVDLDFAEISLEEEINEFELSYINSNCVSENEKYYTYGYREIEGEIRGTNIELRNYLTKMEKSDKSDITFMICGEVDEYVEWVGISGAPVWNKRGIQGIILQEFTGDGLKTRIKIISFNKIIIYFIKENKENLLENLPQECLKDKINERISLNEKKCEKLYKNIEHKYEFEDMNMIVNCFNINNKITQEKILEEIKEVLEEYTFFLEDIKNMESIRKLGKKLDIVCELLKKDYNSIYILLWMMTEGMISAPKIGKIGIEIEETYEERDVFIKSESNKEVKILIPFISEEYKLYKSINKLIDSIVKNNEMIDMSNIQWDGEGVKCLNYREKYEIKELINENNSNIKIEITALVVYESEIYSKIANVLNPEAAIKSAFKSDCIEFAMLEEKIKEIPNIKINLFVLPLNEKKIFEKVNGE